MMIIKFKIALLVAFFIFVTTIFLVPELSFASDKVKPPVSDKVNPTPEAVAKYDCKPRKKEGFNLKKILSITYSVDPKKGRFVCQVMTRDLSYIIEDIGEKKVAAFSARSTSEFQDIQITDKLPGTVADIKAVIQRIEAQWPYEKPKIKDIVIVGSEEYAAATLSDDSIKIHLGLITGSESEDEIAYYLAHEYAHIALRHLKRKKDFKDVNSIISSLTDIYKSSLELQATEWYKASEKLVLSKEEKLKMEASIAKSEETARYIRSTLETTLNPIRKRSDEDEADVLAYDLSLKAGYDASDGMTKVFNRMEEVEKLQKTLLEKLGQDFEKSLTETANSQSEFLKKYTKSLIQNENSATEQKKLTGDELFENMKKDFNRQIRQNFNKTLKGALSHEHRRADIRGDGLSKYISANYTKDEEVVKEQAPLWLRARKESNEFKRAKSAVNQISQSKKYIAEGNIPAARKVTNSALKGDFKSTPMVLNQHAYVLVKENKHVEAHKVYLIAHKSKYQSGDAYRDHINLLFAHKLWAYAETVTKEAAVRFGDKKPYLPDFILISFSTKKQDEGVKYLNECIAFEESKLKDDCIKNVPTPESKEFAILKEDNKKAILNARAKVNSTEALKNDSNRFLEFLGGVNK